MPEQRSGGRGRHVPFAALLPLMQRPAWTKWAAQWHRTRWVSVKLTRTTSKLEQVSRCGAWENFVGSNPHHRSYVVRHGLIRVRTTPPPIAQRCTNCGRAQPSRIGA